MLKNIEVILTDLDGTLIDTDQANNLAYRKAIDYYNPDFQIPLMKRITKDILDNYCTDEVLANKIEKLKIQYNSKYLDYTYLNKELFNVLNSNKEYIRTSLVTKASPERATLLLKHHNCAKLFDGVFFCKHIGNKYRHALKEVSICSKKVLVFEDDQDEIRHANEAGIPKKNIIKISL